MDWDDELRRFSMQTPVRSRAITFTSGKGGTGTTVLALNTAILLAQRGKRVVIFDGNLAVGNVSVLLGHAPRYDLQHVLAREKRLTDILVPGPQGIQVIPGSMGATGLNGLDAEDLQDLLGQIPEVQANFDFLLIDTGSSITPTALELILAADETIVVTRPEPTALASAYALMKIVVQHRAAYPFHLLLNMVRDEGQAEQVRSSLARILNSFLGYQPGYAGFVAMDENVGRSVVQQVPFVLHAPRARATQCLLSLVEKLAPREKGLGIESQGTPPLWRRIIDRRQR